MADKQHLRMSIREMSNQRAFFYRAPEATDQEELSLLEKQALIDEILRGMPIKQIEYYQKGQRYMVVKGWPQIQAIFDYMDNKFCTWTAEEMQQWQQRHK